MLCMVYLYFKVWLLVRCSFDGGSFLCYFYRVWQHCACMGIRKQTQVPDAYLCEECDSRKLLKLGPQEARRLQLKKRKQWTLKVRTIPTRAETKVLSLSIHTLHIPPIYLSTVTYYTDLVKSCLHRFGRDRSTCSSTRQSHVLFSVFLPAIRL